VKIKNTEFCQSSNLLMARVEKLQIIGFRSFGADDDPGPQKIDFVKREGATPLTLILVG